MDAELGVPEPADPSVVLGAPGPDKMFCEGGEKDSCGGRVIRPLPDGIAPDALARARWPDWDGLQVARWTSAAQLLGVVLFVGIEGLLSTRAAKSGAL